MPKVYITTTERRNAKLAAWIYGEMKVQRITQSAVAAKLGISQPSFNRKLRNHNFDFEDFTALVELFNPEDGEIARLVRG